MATATQARQQEQMQQLLAGLSAVRGGDFSTRLPDGQDPLMNEIAAVFNGMNEQLSVFTSEVTRVAREVGIDGKLGGQAQVPAVAGTWKDLTDSVNGMAGNLTSQVRNIAQVTTAVARGDLSQKISVEAKGEVATLAETINGMVDTLSAFAGEVTRVAREVGTDGRLGGQAEVPGVGGTWRDLTDSVNFMAGNLTSQVRNIAQVTTAVAKGDLSQKITVDARGEILELKNTVNTMVDQLSAFAGEVTRMAREVGTEGRLGGQAQVPGVGGTWRDLTDSVNFMAGNLTVQVRSIAQVATAVAKGDLSQKITVDARGEILELKNTINTMVDTLSDFAGEVTRVAREVGTEGRLGGQADVQGVSGTWKDLTESVNVMAANLTAQVRSIAQVTTAVAKGDLSQKIRVDARGEILELKETINTMVDQLSSFAGEVTRVARDVGTQGKLGGQAIVQGVSGTWEDLTDNVNVMASNLTAQVRSIAQVATAVARGDLSQKITVEAKGEVAALAGTDQRDGGHAVGVRRRGHQGGPRGGHRRPARRPGDRAERGRDLEGPDRQRQLDGQQPDQPGPQHRPGHDRRRARRPDQEDRRRRAGRDPRAEDHHQHDGRPAIGVRRRSHPGGQGGRPRRPPRRPGRGRRRFGHLEAADAERERARREPHQAGPGDLRGDKRGRDRRPDQVDRGRGQRRGRRAQGQHQHDGPVAARDHRGQPAARLAADQPGADRRPDAGSARPGGRRRADHGRAHPDGRRRSTARSSSPSPARRGPGCA